jgi:hypothetical protein
LPEGAEENGENVKIAGDQAGIWKWYVRNMKQNWYTLRRDQSASSSEHDKETSGSTKDGEFVDKLTTGGFSRRTLFRVVSYATLLSQLL